MPHVAEDTRTAARQVLDEALALEYERGLTVPDFRASEGVTTGTIPPPPTTPPRPPEIIPAVVKDGCVQPLDAAATLPEGRSVAIVIAR